MICRRCVFHNAQVEDKQFGKYAPSKKITHGRCKVEGTGAGEVASGMGCLESRSSWRGAEVKCNAKVTQSRASGGRACKRVWLLGRK